MKTLLISAADFNMVWSEKYLADRITGNYTEFVELYLKEHDEWNVYVSHDGRGLTFHFDTEEDMLMYQMKYI